MTQSNFVTIKLVDYSDYVETHHLRAVRSGWRDGKAAFVEAEPDAAAPATLAEREELTRDGQQN